MRFLILLLLLLTSPLLAQLPVTWQDTTKEGDSALTIAYKRRIEVTDSTKLVRLITATNGIPNGPFHLTPTALCANPDFSASTLNANATTLLRDLGVVQACKKRVVLLLKRSAMKNVVGLSAVTATAEIATWPDISAYVKDGTVIAVYVGDDIGAEEWGPITLLVRLALMDEIACSVRRRWPTVPTVIRAKPVAGRMVNGRWEPGELGDRPTWNCLTTAWAQFRGPYRDGPPKKWIDSMAVAAARLKLGLIGGHNLLDGGCGPPTLLDGRANTSCLPNVPGTAILGTYVNAATYRRYQTSASELTFYKIILVSAPGVCASLDWRESQGWSASRPAAQLTGVQGFSVRPSILASFKAIAIVARTKTPASCIHFSRN